MITNQCSHLRSISRNSLHIINQMQKRVLPARSTRGQAPKLTAEQQQKDKELYQKVFQNMEERGQAIKQESRSTFNKILEKTYELEKRQMICKNIKDYPYSRGYHYFFDLRALPRISGSVSYVSDQENLFNSNFSQDNKQQRAGIKLGKLFNRKYFGLPLASMTRQLRKSQDKNVCHGYLFANEDKKYKLDLAIRQLSWIVNHIETISENNQFRDFDVLRKDFQLSEIYQNQGLTLEDKREMIAKRISVLQQRKAQMRESLLSEDKTYFYHSLNQKLHNQISRLQKSLTIDKILSKLIYNQNLMETLYKEEGNDRKNMRQQAFQKIFKYQQTSNHVVIDKKTIQKLSSEQYKQKLLKFPIDDSVPQQFLHFQKSVIILPCQLFDFSNDLLFERLERVISNKMYQVSDSVFYICKSMWRKLFSRSLELKQKDKFITKQEYLKIANIEMDKIKRNGKFVEPSDQSIFKYPDLSDLLDHQALDTDFSGQQRQKMIFKNNGGIQINTKQFICLNLFHQIYRSLGQFQKTGVPASFNHQVILGSQFYVKIHHSLTEKIGTARYGIIQELLRKISEIIQQIGHTMDLKIMCEYNKTKKIMMTWIQDPGDWQSVQEQVQQQQQQLQKQFSQNQDNQVQGQMIEEDQVQERSQLSSPVQKQESKPRKIRKRE